MRELTNEGGRRPHDDGVAAQDVVEDGAEDGDGGEGVHGVSGWCAAESCPAGLCIEVQPGTYCCLLHSSPAVSKEQ